MPSSPLTVESQNAAAGTAPCEPRVNERVKKIDFVGRESCLLDRNRKTFPLAMKAVLPLSILKISTARGCMIKKRLQL
jgi:hypothetical protein